MAPSATRFTEDSELTSPPAPSRTRPSLSPGIYVPTAAFFNEDESIDLEATKKHAITLATAGMKGIVTHGSNGEAVHLNNEERTLITKATREALDATSHQSVVVIAGCGAQSTRETIRLCVEAASSGAQYALVLPPSYYGSLLDETHILGYFHAVADKSPIGILIYNFPGATPGVDLTSDQIIALSEHPNICGVKLTCGNTGKLARVAAAASPGFLVMGGSADFLLQTLVVGGHGVIASLANLAPKLCVETMRLYQQGELTRARELQGVLARGDWVAIRGGFIAVKKALSSLFGYGGVFRLPFTSASGPAEKELRVQFKELMEHEAHCSEW